jgi:MinD superfamily P-loop ATPase
LKKELLAIAEEKQDAIDEKNEAVGKIYQERLADNSKLIADLMEIGQEQNTKNKTPMLSARSSIKPVVDQN